VTLQRIWHFTRRWWWLCALAILLAAVTSYVASSRLAKVYEGTAKLLVTPSQSGNGQASYNDVLTAERLTRTYSEVLKTRPIVESGAQQAGLGLSYERALAQLDVKPVANTQLIQISARASDPELAARFANAVTNAFVQYTQTSQLNRFAASKDNLTRQVDQLSKDIADRSSRVDTLRTDPPSAARDSELGRLQGELTQLQQSYTAAARSLEDLRVNEARSTDLLAVVEPATPSPDPVSPNVTLNVGLAVVLALILALAMALTIEHLDDRLNSAERITRFTGLHLLGSVPRLSKDSPRMLDQLPATSAPSSSYQYGAGGLGEMFRLLRANLQFAAIERPLRTLLVTSAEQGDGKTTVASNLAIVLAQAGQQVLLVEADMRRPSIHDTFDVPNRVGLTSLLVNEGQNAASASVATRVPGLRVIPSGPLPPNPSELLASTRMRSRLAELRELADIVILDSPPVLAVSDPAILAGQVDGTLLVASSDKTRGQRANQTLTTLQKAGAHVLGIILNRTRRSDSEYYAYESRGAEAQTSSAPSSAPTA
jgi:capsular exopolysaccharide synthesis family protein